MNVDVCIENADLKGALRTYIKRRLHFALGRFAGKVGHVRVRVGDVPGVNDLLDASCHIRAELLPTGRILQREAVDQNLYIAVDLAAERLSCSFGRELDRAQTFGTVGESNSTARISRGKGLK